MQNKYRSILVVFFVVFIGLILSSLSHHFFSKTQSDWLAYAERVAVIDRSVSKIKNLIGYGGFIHDFKNMVLRGDIPLYEEKLNKEIAEIPVEIDSLYNLLESPEDREALNDIRTTFEEYASKYEDAKKMILAGNNNKDIDKTVMIDDAKAITALMYLDIRVNERLSLANNKAEKSYSKANIFYLTSSLLFIILIFNSAYFLMRNERKLISIANSEIAAREEAEHASLAKSQFLSSMSHELRTPLNAILGFSQLIALDEKDEDRKKNIQEIIDGGNHLLDLINEVLDLARIESGNITLSIKEHSLNKIIKNTLPMIKPLADKHAIQIDGNISSLPDININVDDMRFKQVLLNILSNAIKYNSEKGKVTIDGSSTDENMFCLSISDTGKGFTIKQLSHLFEPFERFGADNSHIEGTGLGLVIAKDLIELMNGRITVESEIGKGSRFIIEIPLS